MDGTYMLSFKRNKILQSKINSSSKKDIKNDNPLELLHFGNNDNKSEISDMPVHTLDFCIEYDDPELFTISLKGHYIWWRYNESDRGKYDDVIWDAILSKKILTNNKIFTEIFLSAHNIFNGSQYKREKYNKMKSWLEAGMKFRF